MTHRPVALQKGGTDIESAGDEKGQELFQIWPRPVLTGAGPDHELHGWKPDPEHGATASRCAEIEDKGNFAVLNCGQEFFVGEPEIRG